MTGGGATFRRCSIDFAILLCIDKPGAERLVDCRIGLTFRALTCVPFARLFTFLVA